MEKPLVIQRITRGISKVYLGKAPGYSLDNAREAQEGHIWGEIVGENLGEPWE